MAYKDPMLELFASLPKMLMEYKQNERRMAQQESQFERELALSERRLDISEEQNVITQQMDILKYQTDTAMAKADSYENKMLQYMNEIDKIETELQSIGVSGWQDKISSLPELYKSSAGEQMPSEYEGNVVKTMEWLMDDNRRMANEAKKEFESARAYEDALTDEFTKLQNLKEQKSFVNPWLAGEGTAAMTIDADDMEVYFDTELSYDGSDEGKADFRMALEESYKKEGKTLTEEDLTDAWKAHTMGKYDSTNEDYEQYKELFMSWEPGHEEDMKMIDDITLRKANHRKEIDVVISDTYSSIVQDYQMFATEYEGKDATYIWDKLLSRGGTNEQWEALGEDQKNNIVLWLQESQVKQGGAKEWYDKMTATAEGQAAMQWLMTDPQFGFRLQRMEDEVSAYNDPYSGQGTTKQQLADDQFMGILDETLDPAEIYKKFVGISGGILDPMIVTSGYNAMTASAKIMAEDYSNDLTDQQRESLLNLDNTLTDFVLRDKGNFQEREGAVINIMNRELDSIEIQLKEAYRNNNQVLIDSLLIKKEEAKQAKRQAQTGAMRGLGQSEQVLFELGTEEDTLPVGSRVVSVLDALGSDPDLMQTIQSPTVGLGHSREMDHPSAGYEYGRDNPHDITDYKSSSQINLEGDSNPYIEAFDAKAEEIWDDINVEMQASTQENPYGLDPFGPDFIHYYDQHPLGRLERAVDMGVISVEEYDGYKAQMESAGNAALTDRLDTILSNPSEHKDDYRELIEIIGKSQKHEKLIEALDKI